MKANFSSITFSPFITPRQIVYAKKQITPAQIIYRLKKRGIKPLNIIIDSNDVNIKDRCLEISEDNRYVYCDVKDAKDLVALMLESVLFSNYCKIVKFRTYRVYTSKYSYYTVKWIMIIDSKRSTPEALIICFYPTHHNCYSTLVIFLF